MSLLGFSLQNETLILDDLFYLYNVNAARLSYLYESSVGLGGLSHDIRLSFVQERVYNGRQIISSVKFIQNESFLSEFIGVFITERNTHSGRPFLPVQCKRGTAFIFV